MITVTRGVDVPKGFPALVLKPPIEPMLAKLADALPEDYLYEPKWDGFRALVFRSAEGVYIQSRDGRPLDRYFPELHDSLMARLPKSCVLDGEIVITASHGLDFDALQLRLHPAASRIKKLASETPSSYVAFDLLAIESRNLLLMSQIKRRQELVNLLSDVKPPIFITPMTEDRSKALEWLKRFEGAGLDGVVAKAPTGSYLPGKRAMIKVKHIRTAECVVAGFRWHKSGRDATTNQVSSSMSALLPHSLCQCAENSLSNYHGCARTQWLIIHGATGLALFASPRGCPVQPAAGVPGKTYRGKAYE